MLHALARKSSVSSYVNDFKNILITILHINEDEKLNEFSAELKPMVHLKVQKAGLKNLKRTVIVALNVGNASKGAGMLRASPCFLRTRDHSQ